MAKSKKGKAKKAKVIARVRMSDEAAEKFFKQYAKVHEIKPTEASKWAVRYAGRRLAALARDNKKHAA